MKKKEHMETRMGDVDLRLTHLKLSWDAKVSGMAVLFSNLERIRDTVKTEKELKQL